MSGHKCAKCRSDVLWPKCVWMRVRQTDSSKLISAGMQMSENATFSMLTSVVCVVCQGAVIRVLWWLKFIVIVAQPPSLCLVGEREARNHHAAKSSAGTQHTHTQTSVTLTWWIMSWHVCLCRKLPSCHHSSLEQHRCHVGSCPACKQPCGRQLKGCNHLCPAPCHDQVLVKSSERVWQTLFIRETFCCKQIQCYYLCNN